MKRSDTPQDDRNCRVRKITDEIYECLEAPDRPRSCGHSYRFGFTYYCRHRDRHTFVGNC